MLITAPAPDAPSCSHFPGRCHVRTGHLQRLAALLIMLWCAAATGNAEEPATYESLRAGFARPDHARWGEVPLWWWEGDPMTRERVTWQLETLAAQGVKSVCPIQRSPGRCDPPSFSPEWWEMLAFVHRECRRLGMTLWAYDQVGYGHYGWLEKAAAQAQDQRTARVVVLTAEGESGGEIRLELPEGTLLAARAYPLTDGTADDEHSIDVRRAVDDRLLRWTPSSGKSWRVAAVVVAPHLSFHLSDRAADTFLDLLYGEVERRLGAEAMGTSFAGMFQDEHPPTPRDLYTAQLANTFRERFGYEIARAIPALHFDVGPRTPKYRTDFFDAYLAEDERCYWKRVYDWTAARNVLTSHDNWGRCSLPRQSQGYIDYFRTQRWFSAPGYDDAGQHPVAERNYYDTKIAASIARLYDRPRVWSEAFHSSGWGRTTDQTLSWLSANYVFGANLYDEHGLYYSARASTWEHAAPDPHWRQPYWRYYGHLSDWVARLSYLMCQGKHVVDVAVHYPVVSHLAGEAPGDEGPNYDLYMRLSRALFDQAIDNDIVDDDSIRAAQVDDGTMTVAGNRYQALVFGPETTIRRSVLQQARRLAETGGCVVFYERLPTASTEAGREDPEVRSLLHGLLGEVPPHGRAVAPLTKVFPGGGCAAFLPAGPAKLPPLIADHIQRDFVPKDGQRVYVLHRRIGNVHAYLLQNPGETALPLEAVCRADGVAERWDLFSGEVHPVRFSRTGKGTRVRLTLRGNTAQVLVLRPGKQRSATVPTGRLQPEHLERTLPEDWQFSVIPTRDNRWGEFRWPPSSECIGPEIRRFRYAEEDARSGVEPEWHRPAFDDSQWSTARYSIGPYWLQLSPVPQTVRDPLVLASRLDSIQAGSSATVDGRQLSWQAVEFSQTIGLARPAPWGGHSGYPDGAIDQNFIELPQGRKLLFTRIRSPQDQRLGLRVELRNSACRLWVNGVEQPVEGALGNLPLKAGINTVLLDLPDGQRGMLYVQATPPAARTLADAAAAAAKPDLRQASWIRAGSGGSCYVRRTFRLDQLPQDARIVVTGYTGYRLFINGTRVEEEIGPWARWTHPESINITPLLQRGENVIAAWVQVHSGQHFRGTPGDLALALAFKAELPDGTLLALTSDGSWKGAVREQEGWEKPGFDDGAWTEAQVVGAMGDAPWGMTPVENVGRVTEPRRKLAIDLPSPYLTCFDEVPDIAYDVKPAGAGRVGWFRFDAPPGLQTLLLRTDRPMRVWVDGQPVPVQDGKATVAEPPAGVSQVAVRVEMEPGRYAGAAFPSPIGVELRGGTIQPGLWSDFAMPTYSGIGVYRQRLTLTAEQARRPTELDLGQVHVAAELLVNGKSLGVRLARPFAFDLTGRLQPGDNELEVRVANTIAPHYTVTNEVHNLGPTDSGLLGPVVLRQRLAPDDWSAWAAGEIARLRRILATPTPALAAAQRQWQQQPQWTVLAPAADAAGRAAAVTPDGWLPLDGSRPNQTTTLQLRTDLRDITGLRFEWAPRGPDAAGLPGRHVWPFQDARMIASLPDGDRIRGQVVRVQMVDKQEYLHLAEVQVFSGGENIAPQGEARQSSTHPEGPAERAIDRNTDGSWQGKSVCHTHLEQDPWWEVDLGSTAPVDRIVIWNRTDGNLQTRLSRFRVSLRDASGSVVWQRLVTTPPDPRVPLWLSPAPVELRDVSPRVAAAAFDNEQRGVRLFATDPFGYPAGTRLAIKLTRKTDQDMGVQRLRVSATTMRPPLYDVPPPMAAILAQPADQRTDRQRARLAAFYRSIAPQLEPVRQRLARLLAEQRETE